MDDEKSPTERRVWAKKTDALETRSVRQTTQSGELLAKVVFTSCVRYSYDREQPIWDTIKAFDPDLLLLLGDNVYTKGWNASRLEQRYIQQCTKVPTFQWLLTNKGHVATWDDHDLGPNNAKGGSKKGLKNRDAARNLLFQYLGNKQGAKGSLLPVEGEIYCSYELAGCYFIVLDGRYYSESLKKNPNAALLGQAQEEWLWKQLHIAQTGGYHATFVCCGSTIEANGELGESVSHYQWFYEEFRREFEKCPIPIFLSGDIHENKFFQHDGFIEAISSGAAQLEDNPGYKFWKLGKRRKRKIANFGEIYLHDDHLRINLISSRYELQTRFYTYA